MDSSYLDPSVEEQPSRWRGVLESVGTHYGQILISCAILLVAFGTVMIFSASFYQHGVDGDVFFYLRRQLLWIPIALLSCLVAYHFDYRILARAYPWIVLITIILLALVFVPGIGLDRNFSKRWIRLDSLQFQPSELAKFAAIVFIAGFFSRDPGRLLRFWRGYLPVVGALFVVVSLIVVEPDFGTPMFILALTGILLLVAGVRKIFVLSTVVVFAPVFVLGLVVRWETIQSRVLGFLDPEKVYQVRHSLLALGSGGVFGKGLGAGHQKLKFLPEPYTDFILSIVGEELGFVGCATVILLFLVLLWASIGIAARARDYFGFVLASGIALSLAMQAATNIAVVTASAPTKGIPLPFLTFGGSGLCMTLAQVGILLSVDRVRRLEGPLIAKPPERGSPKHRDRTAVASAAPVAMQEGV